MWKEEKNGEESGQAVEAKEGEEGEGGEHVGSCDVQDPCNARTMLLL